MLFWVCRINQYVIQVDDNTNIKQVSKDFVHVVLECGQGIAKAEVHNQEFKGPIVGPEGHFPFVAFSNPDKVVCPPEVKFGELFGRL